MQTSLGTTYRARTAKLLKQRQSMKRCTSNSRSATWTPQPSYTETLSIWSSAACAGTTGCPTTALLTGPRVTSTYCFPASGCGNYRDGDACERDPSARLV